MTRTRKPIDANTKVPSFASNLSTTDTLEADIIEHVVIDDVFAAAGPVPPPLPRGPERRGSPRVPYFTPLRLKHADGSVEEACSEDIAVGGLAVLGAREVAVGDVVYVRFVPPTHSVAVTVPATVRWSKPLEHAAYLGLAFAGVPHEVVEAIEAYASICAVPDKMTPT